MADKKIADKLLGRLFEFGGLLVYAAGALTSLGGLGFVLYQCGLWLRDGFLVIGLGIVITIKGEEIARV